MMLQHLFEHYGLSCYFDRTSDGTWLRAEDSIIHPVPLSAFQEPSIESLAMVSEYLIEKGEPVVRILKTNNGDSLTEYEGSKWVVLSVPNDIRPAVLTGESLASFHQHTQIDQSSYNENRPYLNWSHFWQSRADQTYSWMEGIMKDSEPAPFESRLLHDYSYYAGRAENAIQYMVDLMLDAHVDEGACFCHHRISSSLLFNKQGSVHWPTNWVIDHPGRDIGEWLRTCCKEVKSPEDHVIRFVEGYKKVRPISKVGASIAYARLLFPLSFFETVEGYFSGQLNEEESFKSLEKCEEISAREEVLLSQFETFGISPITKIDWLSRV